MNRNMVAQLLRLQFPMKHSDRTRVLGRCVLIVDDEEDTRELLGGMLARAGANVIEAASVEEALECFRIVTVDLVVSDIRMPGRDGYSFIRELRQRAEVGSTVPALALTACVEASDREKALEAGFDMHAGKPIGAMAILELAVELMSKHPRSRRLQVAANSNGQSATDSDDDKNSA